MEKPELISVIIPVLNEEKHIGKLMDALAKQDYPRLEFLLTDGGSTDGTRTAILQRKAIDPRFKMISNPLRFVSHGFNIALREAEGKFIAFLGAHAVYPDRYLSEGYKVLSANLAEAVGGPLIHQGLNATGKAIALAMTSGFGVGNTAFRTSSGRQYVDSVAFALYKKEVFEKIGGMDESLIRNQDDEFHYRMNAAGMRILMVPSMQAEYYVRSSYKALFQQYFEYGLYKPMVLKKVNSGARWRHFIPSLWLLYLILLPISLFCIPFLKIFSLLPLIVYLSSAIFFSVRISGEQNPLRLICAFFTLHLAYGAGFLRGLSK
jgi:GT2 family glycosyltransferase